MATAVPNFCSMKSVILAKWTLLILSSVASLSETSFWSTALKCFSCRFVMSTKWSTLLLLEIICISRVEMQAELKVDNVSAAVDMPSATRSRKQGEGKTTYIVSAHFRCVVSLFGKLT